MNNTKKRKFFVYSIILLCLIVANVVIIGRYKSDNSEAVKKRPVPVGRYGRPISSSEMSAYEDRKALEAYEKRNAEIDSWIEEITTETLN